MRFGNDNLCTLLGKFQSSKRFIIFLSYRIKQLLLMGNKLTLNVPKFFPKFLKIFHPEIVFSA